MSAIFSIHTVAAAGYDPVYSIGSFLASTVGSACVWAAARSLYRKYPAWRKQICAGLLIIGFLSLLSVVGIIYCCSEDAIRGGVWIPMVVLLFTGMINVFIGYRFLNILLHGDRSET